MVYYWVEELVIEVPPLNLETVAKAAGVSLATASLALNDHPRVNARTKLRVMEAAERLGYVPHHAARRLVHSRKKATQALDQVGFVLFDTTQSELDMAYFSLMRGMEYELSRNNITIAFLRVASETDRKKIARLARSGWVDGWIMVGKIDDESLDLVQGRVRPCVILGAHECKAPVQSVDVDYEFCGRMVVEYFASLGHRRIAYLGGSMRFQYQVEMLKGFQNALNEFGLDVDERLIRTFNRENPEPFDTGIERLMALDAPPTGLYGSELNIASCALDVLRQRFELQVPGDLSILGCQLDAGSTANITRIELPFAEVGRAGAVLLREIAAQPAAASRRVHIAPRLIEGWSCRRLSETEPKKTFPTLPLDPSANQG